MRQLLIGCGNSRSLSGIEVGELVTVDIDPNCGADVLHDLNVLPYPFRDESFDQIHAYEVLEHCGTQGDWRFFFGQFQEFWRVLKPGGILIASVPIGPWVWGDPGHTRTIQLESLVFLSQAEYQKQVGKTHMTDYRHVWKGDFELVAHEVTDKLTFILKAIK